MIEITPEYLASQGLSETFPERFWKRVFITPTHWLWEGNRRAPANHGSLWRGVKNAKGTWAGNVYAHVASWIMHRGPVPDKMLVLHCCPGRHIPWCVNPDHLYLGSFKDNTRDIIAQGRLHFHMGHAFTPKGPDAPTAVLTQEQIDEICQKYETRKYKQWDLAREYRVSQSCVSHHIIAFRNRMEPKPHPVTRQ